MKLKLNIVLGIFILIILLPDLSRLLKQLTLHSNNSLMLPSTLPSPTTQAPRPSPTPIPSPISRPITSNRIQVEFNTAKQLGDPFTKEGYLISFDKITPNSAYKITNNHFATLIIFDDNYEFSLQIPKEGHSNPFSTFPPTEIISTLHLGKLTRITNPFYYSDINPVAPNNNQTEYYYTTNFDTDCTQWSPIPAACSVLQVASNNKVNPESKIYSYLICKTSNSTPNLCDRLISTLEIELK